MPWVPWMESIFQSHVDKGEATSSATARALWAQVFTEFGPSCFKLDYFGFIIIFNNII